MGNGAFPRELLADVVPKLVATARGDLAATLVIRNGKLVNVCSGEVVERISIAVQGSRIAYVGFDVAPMIGEETKIIDADGAYIAPGLLDGHCHVESSQLTVSQFAKAILPHGTTGIFYDAHEIANVLGKDGLKMMLEEGRMTPLSAYMAIASCVPASSLGFETPGALFGPDDIREMMTWGPDVISLGEVMNFPGVVFGDEVMMGEIQSSLRAGRVIDGHFTWPVDDWKINAYAAAGITSDHELTKIEDVIERVRLGMYAMMRRGSAWHDVEKTIKAYTERKIDPRRLMLVTDDRNAESLVQEGHMDFVVRHAIAQGVPPVVAFQMATINTAERFGISRDIGTVTPASNADIILLDGDLANVKVSMTIAAGQVVAENGKMTVQMPTYHYPKAALQSVHINRSLVKQEFVIPAPISAGLIDVRAIQLIENSVETKEVFVSVPVYENQLCINESNNLCKIAVVERHSGKGTINLGLLSGVGLTKPAAVAMTVAHDSHNLLVIGNNDELMVKAGNTVIDLNGGIVVVMEDGTTTQLRLPVAGLMSMESYEVVADQSAAVSAALKAVGCNLNYAFMTLSLLALVVIPTLRISDKGLVKVTSDGFKFVTLYKDDPTAKYKS
ncbi:adenine deaminase [Bacillus sp. Marseille-P3661]|uniref:adenine deaminase n=1 Tax=Bacillus sp. Marseille-P3661 TaxID=1936234 RepID=UPI000C846D58|nr:adenine deaminase [Bacillus sp. Marseille-P3661]